MPFDYVFVLILVGFMGVLLVVWIGWVGVLSRRHDRLWRALRAKEPDRPATVELYLVAHLGGRSFRVAEVALAQVVMAKRVTANPDHTLTAVNGDGLVGVEAAVFSAIRDNPHAQLDEVYVGLPEAPALLEIRDRLVEEGLWTAPANGATLGHLAGWPLLGGAAAGAGLALTGTGHLLAWLIGVAMVVGFVVAMRWPNSMPTARGEETLADLEAWAPAELLDQSGAPVDVAVARIALDGPVAETEGPLAHVFSEDWLIGTAGLWGAVNGAGRIPGGNVGA